ncbi:MAG: MBL fold metallo-hydrolase [Candidatus Aenigmarchaeota archaeon]|nr:MBL fold metallo-hydrolase [Candidatus Aenigmarchaeota archaeon]
MIEIKFLGGASEVGRSCFLIDTGVEKFLLDYGLNVQGFTMPMQPPISLDAVLLSHAHLDHCGLIPELYKRGFQKSVFATKSTLDLTNLLLEDSIKIQTRKGMEPFYSDIDINTFVKRAKRVDFGQPIEFTKSVIELHDAGHIPGSAATLIDTGKKRLLYTGDLNYSENSLMKASEKNYSDIDTLIIESTYSYKNHPNRNKLANSLRETVKGALENGGTVLLPAFAVGRTQEILMLVYDLGFPVYMDGMGITATKIALKNLDFVSNPTKLKKAFGKAHKIGKTKDRQKVLDKPCIVIASAGMLQGGPIHHYIKKLKDERNCSLIMTGFQVEGTVGRTLLDTKKFVSNGSEFEVKMDIQFMDFSAHIGRDDLFKFIEQVNPQKVIPVHGEFIPEFIAELKDKGFETILAKNGDVIKI